MWWWFRRKEPPTPPRKQRKPGELSAAERATIDAAISVLQIGRVPIEEDYSRVDLAADGIVYGRHRANMQDGSLQAVIESYYDEGGSLRVCGIPEEISTIKETMTAARSEPQGKVSDRVAALLRGLERAGKEPAMQRAQRHVHDIRYGYPSDLLAQRLGLRYPLSYLCVRYVGIQGGVPRPDALLSSGAVALLQPGIEQQPPAFGGHERAWVVALLVAHARWLAGSRREEVRLGVERVYDLQGLCDDRAWDLELPITLRGVRIGARAEI